MASNLESPTRSRSQHKQKRNENMEGETNSKEDALERSVEEIRFKMIEKRRKKVQADLSLSRSRYKNANLVLKASLRHNNRNLARSLETARNECRQAQNDLVELQRERHLLQSVVNRFQDQHVKQRNQIKGVHETLRKVTSSLMDTVGLLGQAMDMCVIPRHTKDRSLGLVFRTSSLTSDDLSDSETKEGGSASVETSSHNLSSIPRRIPANRDTMTQSPLKTNPSTEEIEDLPDIDVPLLFVSDKSAPQGRERNRRDPKKISAGNQKLSRRTSSLLDPATIAAVATEIEKSAENIRTVVEETDDDGDGSSKGQALICIDDEVRAPSDEIEGVKSAEEKQDRRVTQKRSGRLSLRKEGEAAEHGHIEEKENGIVQIAEESQGRRDSKKKSGRSSSRKEVEASEYDPTEDIVSSLNKDIEVPLDDDHKGKGGKRKSRQISKKRKTYVCPDDDEDEIIEKAECMELDLEDEEIVERSSSRRGSRKRSGRLSRRRETFVKEDSDLKTLEIDDDLQEIQILDDVDDDAAVGSKLDGPNQQGDDAEEVLDDFQQKRESKTCVYGEEASRTAEKQSEKADKKIKKKKDKAVKKKKNNTKDTDLDHGHLIEGLMEADQLDVVSSAQHGRHEGKLQGQNTVPDQRQERVKDDNIAEKSDYRIVDMELTTAASGHISVIEGADLQTKSNEKTRDDEAENSQMSKPGSSSEVSNKEKPKSRLPVLVKGKSKPSKLKKSMHKVQSKMGTNKESIRRRDEKDVQQMTIFDLSMGDSFSHPTPSRLIIKAQNAAGSKADETVEKNDAVCQPTTGRGSGDGLEKIAQAESSNDAETEEALVTQDSETHGHSQEIIREERHSKIKRKSRKSKSVVTPGTAEQKVRLSEKALLEELCNLDASYLSDVTNPERKSKIGASLPSRKSSLKDGGESLNDLMVRPHHRKTSKRKLSKRNFYFGESESEEGHTQSKAEGRSEARGNELNASVLDPDMPYPDSASAFPKSFSSCLNTTTDILEDLESVLLEQAKPRESKKIHRRTTIPKSSGQSSRGASNLNVTFVMDDEGDFEAVKKDKASKTTQNPCPSTAKTSKAKDLKQANRKTFVAGDVASVFFGNFDDANIEGEDVVVDEVEDVTAETVTSQQSTPAAVQPSAGNQQCTIGSRTEKEDVLQALGRSSSKTVTGRLDEPEANKNKENEEHKNKKKVKTDSDALSVSLQDIAEKQTSKDSSVQAASKAEVSSAANDEVGASDRSSNKTQDNQPDESEPERKDEEKKEARVQKTNKRKAQAGDDDILDHKPSKVAKADAESVPEVPERRGRRSKAVSYKEPSLNSKLRQGDPNTCSVYKDLAVKTTKKGKARAPLSNITN